MKTILILYSELAQYTVSCINRLQEERDVDVHLVRWSLNNEAPFKFTLDQKIKVYLRSDFDNTSLVELAKNISPDVIYCSGWMDKGYLAVCKTMRKDIPVVVGMDTRWTGSLKQYIASISSSFTFKKWFSHIWVAGAPQKEYALKLGFQEERVMEGVYSADVKLFQSQYESNKKKKREDFPKKFLYVGRYIELKGVRDLVDAFVNFKEETGSDWELWCCGTGPLKEEMPEHNGIKHFGFVQPDELAKIAGDAGVFVLPSHFEPWGVVVHEFAAAGFPLICADQVGAASKFLENGLNGFTFPAGDQRALKSLFKKFNDMTDSELNEMSRKSYLKSDQITPSTWAKNLLSVANSNVISS